MSLNQQDIAQIDAYLQGRLTGEQLQGFKARINEEEALATEVQSQVLIKEAVTLLEANKVKAQLAQLELQLAQSEPLANFSINSPSHQKTRPTRAGGTWPAKFGWIIGLAAAFALIAVSVWFLLLSPPGPQQLYATYYQPYPNTEDPLTRGQTGELSGYQLYEQERYSKAIAALIPLNTEPAAAFYTAQSYLALNKPEKALPILEDWAIQAGEYQVAFKWYAALTNLKLAKPKQAVTYLHSLATTPNIYRQKAKELLGKLD